VILEYLKKADWPDDAIRRRSMMMPMNYRIVGRFGLEIPEDLENLLDDVRRTRNMATHGRADVTRDDVRKAVKAIEQFEKLLKDHKPEIPKRIEAQPTYVTAQGAVISDEASAS
jgi:Domain of unknown function (DUF4145)